MFPSVMTSLSAKRMEPLYRHSPLFLRESLHIWAHLQLNHEHVLHVRIGWSGVGGGGVQEPREPDAGQIMMDLAWTLHIAYGVVPVSDAPPTGLRRPSDGPLRRLQTSECHWGAPFPVCMHFCALHLLAWQETNFCFNKVNRMVSGL